MAALILLLGGFLWRAGTDLIGQWVPPGTRGPTPGLDQILGVAAAAAGLAVTAWWVLSLLVALIAAALDKSGRRQAAAATGRFCPPHLRRLALTLLAVHLVTAPAAHAAEPNSGPGWAPTATVAVPAWGPAGSAADASAMSDGGAGDARNTEAPQPGGLEPQWRPGPLTLEPGLLMARPVRADQVPARAPDVTVLAGDTLWDIAARQLGPDASDVEVALQWPRWYEANKAAIGDNPDVLLPGQILRPPAAA